MISIKLEQIDRLVVPQVVDFVARIAQNSSATRLKDAVFWGMFEHALNPFHDIIDIGEVPLHAAVVVNLYRLTANDRIGKLEISHVRAAPGPVYGEESQTGDGHVIEVAVGVRD